MLLPRNRTKLDDFLPHVMAMVQGDSRPALPSSVALSYLRNSAIKFAQQSSVLRRKEKIKLQPGQLSYPLIDAPEEEKVYRIVKAYYGDDECCGREVYVFLDDDVMCIGSHEVPSEMCEDVYLTVEFVVIPTRKACSVDEVLHTDWHDAIIDGALEQVHLMPQRPWTSGTASRERQRSFNVAVGEARRKYFNDKAGTRPDRVHLPGGC